MEPITSGKPRETEPVPDTTDWKLKYRNSLLEIEIEEKRWRVVERLLPS
jgi:hypothetical protein